MKAIIREILFRGWFECITGESYWVYGYLNKQTNGNWEIINSDKEYTVSNIGQFTGLLDKKGNKIFEGDIVQLPQKYVNPIIVYWNNEMTGFYPLLSERSCHMEIIGNIHENRELLK